MPLWSLASVGLGLGGVALLVEPGLLEGELHPGGLVALALAAFGWANGSLLSRRLPLPASGLMTVGLEGSFGGLLLLVASVASGEPGRLELAAVSGRSLWALLYLAVMGASVALFAYQWLLRTCSPAAVSSYACVNPAVAVALGWLIGGEHYGSRALVAGLLIVGAVVLLQLGPRMEQLRPLRCRGGTASAWRVTLRHHGVHQSRLCRQRQAPVSPGQLRPGPGAGAPLHGAWVV